jgi:RNA polymerase sigma-70 factor, ECF subfamily
MMPTAMTAAMSTAQSALAADLDAAALTAWVECGDRKALEEIFARHASIALHFAARRTGNRSDAEDAVQDAFLAVMRGARRYRKNSGSVRSWLLAAVLNACAKQYRKDMSRRVREADEARAPTVIASPHEHDLSEPIAKALSELPEHQRLPIELRYLAGLDYDEIAKALGRNQRTVRGQVDRGLDALVRICARLGLAASPTAMLVALGALPSLVFAEDVVTRCAKVARTGPITASNLISPMKWMVASIVAVSAVSVAICFLLRTPVSAAASSESSDQTLLSTHEFHALSEAPTDDKSDVVFESIAAEPDPFIAGMTENEELRVYVFRGRDTTRRIYQFVERDAQKDAPLSDERILAHLVSVELDGCRLQTLQSPLEKICGVPVIFADKALMSHALPNCWLVRLSIREMLNNICDSTDLEWSLEQKRITFRRREPAPIEVN